MQTIDGRQWASREDLSERSGYSQATLANLWRDREANGHPPARRIGRALYWDLEVWAEWFERHQERQTPGQWFERHRHQTAREEPTVDRTGDPDEELPPAGQARVLGVDPGRITQYAKNPPPGWPAPARVEQLPTRVREYRTRRQLWDFADSNPRFRAVGGRPVGYSPTKGKAPDPRIRQAAEALAALPGKGPGEVAAVLAERHGQSVATWKRIITQARKAPQQ
ncbi:hypothetical protein [Streptomyces sp. NPDC059142]|uniref:hypothetical protein n=1 Tax=Streptomyces sp. NPDC059142 TaxID=3346739 RepID=UPI0036A6BD23